MTRRKPTSSDGCDLLHGLPSVAHAHANHFQFHYWFHDLVIGVSADTLHRHRRRLAALSQRGVVLENFVDTERRRLAGCLPGNASGTGHGLCVPTAPDPLRALLGVAAETPVVVQVGNLHKRKGQDLTRAAAEVVWRKHPQAQKAKVQRLSDNSSTCLALSAAPGWRSSPWT